MTSSARFIFFGVLWLGGFLYFVVPTQAITVAPLRQTITIEPGYSNTIKIKVTNDNVTTTRVTAEVEGFTLHEQTGRAVFGNFSEPAISWTNIISPALVLKPNETRTVDFDIFVPTTTLAGSHYLGLFIREASGQGNVGASQRVGSLLFLHVAGTVTEQLQAKLTHEKKWLRSTPLVVTLELKNSGTIHSIPKGEISILNWRKQKINIQQINESDRKILPNGTWLQTFYFNPTWRDIGPLLFQLDGQYGLTNQLIFTPARIWYVPAWPLSSVFIFVLVGIFIYFVFSKRKNKL